MVRIEGVIGGAALLLAWVGAHAPQARAQEAEREVLVEFQDAEAARGLLEHLAPRFRLKTRIRLVLDGEGEADLTIALGAPAGGRPLFRRGAARFSGVLSAAGERAAWTERFLEWLASPPGEHALTSYVPATGAAFTLDEADPAVETAVVVAASPELARQGETIVIERCSRCHVIGERNKWGGLGNTPSFPALRGREGWRAIFEAFWTENPHPSFTQIQGVTPPFDPRFPPPATPLVLTLDEVEAMLAYVATIPPKDLGAPLSIDRAGVGAVGVRSGRDGFVVPDGLRRETPRR